MRDVKKQKKEVSGDDKYAWKNKNPSNKKTLRKVSKLYYWCINHNDGKGMWVLHKPSECNNKPSEDNDDANNAEAIANQALASMDEDDASSDSETD